MYYPVKLTDPETQIQCDINVNNQFGLRNSKLVKAYVGLSPILRPLAMCLKHWARRRALVSIASIPCTSVSLHTFAGVE
jgi:DNA polymerase sigma